MPGTANRVTQPPSNARVRHAAHLERERRNHRKPSPERQARLHPSRAEREWLATSPALIDATVPGAYRDGLQITRADVENLRTMIEDLPNQHQLPWRAPDVKVAGLGWQVLDADGAVAEYAPSRDKARARAKEVNGS